MEKYEMVLKHIAWEASQSELEIDNKTRTLRYGDYTYRPNITNEAIHDMHGMYGLDIEAELYRAILNHFTDECGLTDLERKYARFL